MLLRTRVVAECLRGKTQEEVVEITTVATAIFCRRRSQRSSWCSVLCLVLFVSSCQLLLWVNTGVMVTIEQIVTQLQQKAIMLTAEVADPTGLAEAVRAISNLATAQH